MAKRRIACLGDPLELSGGANRGYIITSGQELWEHKFKVNGVEVAVEGAKSKWRSNPVRTLIPTVTKSFCNGKKIIVEGDPHSGSGSSRVAPLDRSIYVE